MEKTRILFVEMQCVYPLLVNEIFFEKSKFEYFVFQVVSQSLSSSCVADNLLSRGLVEYNTVTVFDAYHSLGTVDRELAKVADVPSAQDAQNLDLLMLRHQADQIDEERNQFISSLSDSGFWVDVAKCFEFSSRKNKLLCKVMRLDSFINWAAHYYIGLGFGSIEDFRNIL